MSFSIEINIFELPMKRKYANEYSNLKKWTWKSYKRRNELSTSRSEIRLENASRLQMKLSECGECEAKYGLKMKTEFADLKCLNEKWLNEKKLCLRYASLEAFLSAMFISTFFSG